MSTTTVVYATLLAAFACGFVFRGLTDALARAFRPRPRLRRSTPPARQFGPTDFLDTLAPPPPVLGTRPWWR